MDTIELNFDYYKETKGTHVWKEQAKAGERPVVGSLYLSKKTVGERANDVPQKLRLTIREG